MQTADKPVPYLDYAGEPMKPGEVRDPPSEIDNLRAQLESATDEAAKYHRIAMDNLEEVARLRDALKNIEARVATLVKRALGAPNDSPGDQQ